MTLDHGSQVRTENQTLGSYLKEQRERRGMSAVELSRVTRIPLASLEAIETDRFDELPGDLRRNTGRKSLYRCTGSPAVTPAVTPTVTIMRLPRSASS